VTLTASTLKTLWHRAVLAVVLVAFLVPMPGRTPADEARAAYAAAGLLCAVDGEGQAHRDAHCVLCLLPAVGAAPDVSECSTSKPAQLITFASIDDALLGPTHDLTRHARAPPSSIV